MVSGEGEEKGKTGRGVVTPGCVAARSIREGLARG